MSPIVWDLGHIATFEDLWLVQKAHGVAPLRGELGTVYDPFSAPAQRPRAAAVSAQRGLPRLHGGGAGANAGAPRRRRTCRRTPAAAGGRLRLRDGAAPRDAALGDDAPDAAAHDLGHVRARPRAEACRRRAPAAGEMVAGARGAVRDGRRRAAAASRTTTSARGTRARPARSRSTRPRSPTGRSPSSSRTAATSGASCGPTRAGSGASARASTLPLYWSRDGEGFAVRSFADTAPLDPTLPVCHVSLVRGRRLRALRRQAAADRGRVGEGGVVGRRTGEKQRYPWGDEPADRDRANLDQLAFGTAPAGAYPAGASPCGALQMIGDVWEWTACGFEAYPGFGPSPTASTREEFFGGPYRVLRGGAWATQPGAVTSTFRNWDYPRAAPALRRLSLRRRPGAMTRAMTDRRTSTATASRRHAGRADRRLPARRRAREPRRRRRRPALARNPKTLPPKYFYDARGSELFEQITELPEYYPTRAEQAILDEVAAEIVGGRAARRSWSSSGPGRPARRTRCSTRCSRPGGRRYVPVDVSESAVEESRGAPGRRRTRACEIHGVVGDFERHLERMPAERRPPPDRLPRRHDRQPRPGPSGACCCGRCAQRLGPGRPAC